MLYLVKLKIVKQNTDMVTEPLWAFELVFGTLEGVQVFANSLFPIQNNLEIIAVTGMIIMYTCNKDPNWLKYVSLVSGTSGMNVTLM